MAQLEEATVTRWNTFQESRKEQEERDRVRDDVRGNCVLKNKFTSAFFAPRRSQRIQRIQHPELDVTNTAERPDLTGDSAQLAHLTLVAA